MFRRILVALDGSPGAERALPTAASLARQIRGSLVLLHMVAPTLALQSTFAQLQNERARTEAIEQVMTDAAAYLAQVPARYTRDLAGISVEMEVAFGTASPTISSTARLEQVDLIILCRHWKSGMAQWGLESAAQQVMRHSPVPLLLLNERGENMPLFDGPHPLRFLVPLDSSLFAETVLEPTWQLLSQGTGSRELCLIHVVDLLVGDRANGRKTPMSPSTTAQARQSGERYLQAATRRLRGKAEQRQDIPITSLVTSDVNIVNAILKQAEQHKVPGPAAPCTIIAIATHGREGVQQLVLGSIAERILSATTLPLLVVCPREMNIEPANAFSRKA